MSNTPMTPTPEGKRLAADLANAVRRERGEHTIWDGGYFEARYGTVHEAFARLATEHLALKAKHEEALADLREIEHLVRGPFSKGIDLDKAHSIAAKWRVETDPLVEVFDALRWDRDSKNGDRIERLRAELSKRGYEIGRKS